MLIASKIKKNQSLYLLCFANLLTVFFALQQNWSILDILFIYWSQSVIIGFFNFFKILSLKNYSVKGFKMNGRTPPANRATKIQVALFFSFHYGFFHFGYLIFLLSFLGGDPRSALGDSIPYILLAILTFFINHLISFWTSRSELEDGRNIGTLMFRPYARIIPMHLIIIIFGAVLSSGNISATKYFFILLVFLFLKTIADVMMHLSEHKNLKIKLKLINSLITKT